MAKQAFLCKYAEIGIKGKNRYKFENALCEQIRRRLAKIDGEFTVVREQGRIFVEADGDYDFEDAIDAMSHVFGVSGISPVERHLFLPVHAITLHCALLQNLR